MQSLDLIMKTSTTADATEVFQLNYETRTSQ